MQTAPVFKQASIRPGNKAVPAHLVLCSAGSLSKCQLFKAMASQLISSSSEMSSAPTPLSHLMWFLGPPLPWSFTPVVALPEGNEDARIKTSLPSATGVGHRYVSLDLENIRSAMQPGIARAGAFELR